VAEAVRLARAAWLKGGPSNGGGATSEPLAA